MPQANNALPNPSAYPGLKNANYFDRFGFFALRELNRLIEDDPKRAEAIMDRDSDSHLKSSYMRDADGNIVEHPNPSNASMTQFQFMVINQALTLFFSPPGPIDICDGEIWVYPSKVPAVKFANIMATALGSKLSDYIQVPGFDIDTIAPKGIDKVQLKANLCELMLAYSEDKTPYLDVIDDLKARVQARIAELATQSNDKESDHVANH